MKPYFTLCLVFCSIILSVAQSTVSLGAEVALPSWSQGNGLGTGFGGSLRYESRFIKNLNWLASIGYLHFHENQFVGGFTTITGSASFIPLMAGIKGYPGGSFSGFYVGWDIGFTSVSASANNTLNYSYSRSDTEFTFSVNIGYHVKNFDLTLLSSSLSIAKYLGIRVAVILGKWD